MNRIPVPSSTQPMVTLLSFGTLGLAWLGIQMDNGPLRIALILLIIVFAMAIGSLIAMASLTGRR
jgi:apolipoprotein N-acyltransferase